MICQCYLKGNTITVRSPTAVPGATYISARCHHIIVASILYAYTSMICSQQLFFQHQSAKYHNVSSVIMFVFVINVFNIQLPQQHRRHKTIQVFDLYLLTYQEGRLAP